MSLFDNAKAISLAGKVVTKLALDGKTIWELVTTGGYTNQVPISIDTDGSIYNGTGYKEGYRLSSSGALKTQTGAVVTGFIPATMGDVVRMSGATWGTTVSSGYSYIVFYDDNFSVVGTINRYMNDGTSGLSNISSTLKSSLDTTASTILTDSNGVTTFNIVFTSAVSYSYIRINATGSGADMIVTVNEEITD